MKNPNIPKKQKGILEDIHSTVNFLAMFDTLEGISFFAKDHNFCLIYANPPFYQSLGLKSRKERLGKNDFELPPNSGQEIQEVRRVDNREVQAHDRPGRTIPKSSGDSGG